MNPTATQPKYSALLLCLALSWTLLACARNSSSPENTSKASQTSVADAFIPSAIDPASVGTEPNPPAFDSARAMQYVHDIVAFGPRPIGSANHKKVEDYIHQHLQGIDVENDNFEVETTEGKFPVHNIIAKFPGSRDGIIMLASHYDTNYPLRNTSYVGANDGGSSSALLLEIANQLRGKRRDGYSVWLIWDDAEESMRLPWYDPESLYGVRHLAQKWQADGTLKKVKGFLLEDMIGDADLNIEQEANSTPWLQSLVYQAAIRLGYQSHFFARHFPMIDDHMPFIQFGVPAVDLIDFDYGYNNVFWHTPQDTVDKLSPKSLEIVGAVTLETIQLLDKQTDKQPDKK